MFSIPIQSKQPKLKLMVEYPCDMWIDSTFITKLSSGKFTVLPISLGVHCFELYDGNILIDGFDYRKRKL